MTWFWPPTPFCPLVGVETRLSWVGLAAEDFSHVTAYENSTTCKPNPEYYGEILRNIGKPPPGTCLMVGNDAPRTLPPWRRALACTW